MEQEQQMVPKAAFDALQEQLSTLQATVVRTPPKLRSQTGEIEHGFR